MADDTPLSELCSICNNAKFKYRCPGCSARTCSLPCYKRHQQWSQCNGKRDPAKFVKKSELATPAGIDHDYNFLTKIERDLEKAEKQVEGRSLGSPSDPRHNANARLPSDQHFAAAGVTVVRAPKGLSRQKENKTHRANKNRQNIVWTVEWIYEDSTRLLTQVSSVQSILAGQPFGRETRKRKRAENQSTATSEHVQQDVSPSIKVQDGVSKTETEYTQPKSPATSGLEPERLDPSATPGDGTSRHAAAAEGSEVKTAKDNHSSVSIDGTNPEPVPPKYAFYLVRPRTSTNRPVLIPLEPTATLGDCLRGRTVLEFPTIHVFPISTTPPSEKFMLEEEYLHQEGEEQKEFEDLIKHVSPETLRALKEDQDGNDHSVSDEIDRAKILNVLEQDIRAGV